MVDDADAFPAVLERVVAWLQERELGTKYKYAMLTDGYVSKDPILALNVNSEYSMSLSPGQGNTKVCWTFFSSIVNCDSWSASFCSSAWDMSKFLNIQCQLSRLKYPQFAKKWINIRKAYGNFYKVLTLSYDFD